MVTFSMTLSDPWPGFQGHVILTSRISQKRCILGIKLLKKPYTIYRMVQLSMTLNDLWPRFQGHDIFRHLISQKRHEIEPLVTIERQWEVISALSHGDISNDLDAPLTRFSRSRHFWSRISQKRCILGTKLLLHNRKLYVTCGMVPCLLTSTDR